MVQIPNEWKQTASKDKEGRNAWLNTYTSEQREGEPEALPVIKNLESKVGLRV